MSRVRGHVYCLASLALLFAPGAIVAAADFGASVEKLFELGNKNTSPALQAARAQYDQLKAANRRDPRLDYAYAVVLLNQRRYADAIPLIDNYLAANVDDSQAARLRLWALLQARRHGDALAQAVKIAQLLPKPLPTDAAKYLDAARFLGKAVGYLDSVQPNGLDPKVKSERIDQLLAHLGQASLGAFDEGRREVADRFAKYHQERQAATQKRALATQEELQEIDDAIAENEAHLAAGQQTIDASGEALRNANRALSVVQPELIGLMQDRARLSAQIITLQVQIAEIQAPRVDPSVNDPNFFGRTRMAVRTDDMLRVNALATTLALLNRQAFEIDKRILALRANAANAIDQGQQQSRTLAETEAALRKAERRAENLEKQARRLETARPATTAAASAEMKRLTTYLPLPYDAETKRILAWFAN
jgi:hypothetical protein